MKRIATALAGLLVLVSCTEKFTDLTDRVMTLAKEQCVLMDARLPDDMMPRNYWPGGLCRPTLHLRGLPADALAGEAVVIKLSGCAADLGK